MFENLQNSLSNISTAFNNQTTSIYTILTICIILVSMIYYFYFLGSRQRECARMTSLYGQFNGKIRAADAPSKYTLKDYYIKSAYNACSGGYYKNDYVDTCNLRNILKQGVRGIDLEIFSIDDQPVVATSTDNNVHIKESFNYIEFALVMDILRNSAFSNADAPNPTDPILLHLRFKSNNQKMYTNLAKLLKKYESILLGQQYGYENQGRNLGDTVLSELLSKVVIIVDKSNRSFMENSGFYEFVNMTSNSIYMRALRYSDIQKLDSDNDRNELAEFNMTGMTIAMPNKGSDPANPNSQVLRDTGCQMLAMRYSYTDTNLEENEKFFDQMGYAFVVKPKGYRKELDDVK